MLRTKQLIDIMPLPFFKVNRDGQILEVSEATYNMFPKSTNFLDLVDLGSRKMARHYIFNTTDFPIQIELSMAIIGQTAHLFDVVADLEPIDESIQVMCISKGQHEFLIDQKLTTLERRTSELGELLHIRDKELEATLNAMKELSLKYDNLSSVKRLAASVAHEIRNPLTTVRGFMQLIKPFLKESGKESYADVAIGEIDRANKIIYEFLNASKSPAPKKEAFNLNTVVRDIVMLCQSEAVLSNVELNFEIPKEDINVMMDSKQIKQVLLNLIQNSLQAIEMTNKSGKIRITATVVSNNVTIAIQDDGIGMDESVLANLFKPFYTTKEDGNGIGLAVCAEIIKGHDGIIEVESKPGEGTTFFIHLPVLEATCLL